MAKAKVIVTADNNINQGLNSAKKSLTDFEKYCKNIESKLKKAFSITAVATATITAVKKIEASLKNCVKEFEAADKVSQRLNAVWENVGRTTGQTAKQIDSYADSLEKQTYFSAESIKESALLLAATESLTEEGFKRALDASVDLAAALGEDVPAAAQLLAKAIQEPDAALSRLKTIGVSFTDQEKEQIKALTDANQLYEAQSVILNKIESRYKNVAKAINATDAGMLDNIRDVLGDIRKDLGEGLLNALSPVLEDIYGWLTNISDWVYQWKTGVTREEAEQIAALEAMIPISDKGYIANVGDYRALEAGMPYFNAVVNSRKDDPVAAAKDKVAIDRYQNIIDTYVDSLSNAASAALSAGVIQTEEMASKIRDALEIGLGASDEVIAQLNAMLQDWDTVLSPTAKAANVKASIEALTSFLDANGSKSISKKMDDINKEIENAWNEYSRAITLGLDTDASYILEIVSALTEEREKLHDEVLQSLFPDGIVPKMGTSADEHTVDDKLDNFLAGVTSSLEKNLGKAGEVAGQLAANMETMGPVLGSIMTALEFVIQGFGETITPMLDVITDTLLAPLVEIGKMLGSIIVPVLQILAPILKLIETPLLVLSGSIQWVAQGLQHLMASFLNWLADLNVFGYNPFSGLRTYDPGDPGNFGSYINGYINSFGNYDASGTASTETALSSASYRGATSVTINIYAEGPIVGDGGMRQFAQMIRDEFDALDYYGVGA